MSRTVRTIVGLVVLVVLVGVGAFAYIYISGGSGEASAPISAPTLELVSAEATTTPTPEATSEATAETSAAATAETSSAASSTSSPTVFNIDSTQSQVSFTLTEELRNVPTTVVGTTDQVAGQIAVDFSNPTTAQLGEIRINARTLATDQDMRNRTIRSQILQSAQDQYEYITFQPTALSGLPDSITIGTPVTFQITGDLTIRDITKSITFDATVTPDSATQLTGKATTTVQRADFDLNIPNVPGVANVSEDVQLEIDFVATAAS